MGNSQADGAADRDLGRRLFLIKAAAAGTAAFAIPTIVSMSPAGASTLVSPPPKPPVDPNPPEVAPGEDPPAQVRGETLEAPEVAPNTATNKAEVAGATLPFTGADVKDLVAGGLAATVGGAALMLWSADPAKAARAATNPLGVTPPEPPQT